VNVTHISANGEVQLLFEDKVQPIEFFKQDNANLTMNVTAFNHIKQ